MDENFTDLVAIERRAQKAGVTMGQVCSEARLAHSTYCRWKSGDTQPTIRSLRKIHQALATFEASRAA